MLDRFKNVTAVFKHFDVFNKGKLRKNELREGFNFMNIRLSHLDFSKVWNNLDVQKKNYVTLNDLYSLQSLRR